MAWIASSPADLDDLLFNRLGCKDRPPAARCNAAARNPLAAAIVTFVWNWQGPSPVLTESVIQAFAALFRTFPLTPELQQRVQEELDRLSEALPGDPAVTKKRHPVAYYMVRSMSLAGFAVMAVPARRLILLEGRRVTAPLLAVCRSLPPGTTFESLTATLAHASLDGCRKDAGRRSSKRAPAERPEALLASTVKAYRRTLSSLPQEILRAAGVLGNVSLALIESEDKREEECESTWLSKHWRPKELPHFSDSDVLKPHTLLRILVREDPDLRTSEDHNRFALALLDSYSFHYGLPVRDLLGLQVGDYGGRLLSFQVSPDELLMEGTVYVPTHERWVPAMLQCRATLRGCAPGDPLFGTLGEDGSLRRLELDDIRRHHARLTVETGEKVSDTILYRSGLCHYVSIGGLNPIVYNRTSNRREPLCHLPRLYTQTTLAEQREQHGAAFAAVRNFLGHTYKLSLTAYEEEGLVVIGGKRALEMGAFAKIWARIMHPQDFLETAMRSAFLHNFLGACRVGEISSLDVRSVDLLSRVVRYHTKGHVRRKGTTKAIPLHGLSRECHLEYLSQRERLGKEAGGSALLVLTAPGGVRPVEDRDINAYYYRVSAELGLPPFTAHNIRYTAKTQFTRAGLGFLQGCALLAHYPQEDVMFGSSSDLSYIKFQDEYLRCADAILSEVVS